jgi:hypothetical protein
VRTLALAGLLFTAGIPAVHGQPSQPAPQSGPAIGFVRNTKSFDSAGCSLWPIADRTDSDRRLVFLSSVPDRAVMNLGGYDTALKLVESSEAKGKLKKGSLSTEHYRGDGVDVVIRYVATEVCAEDDDSCEATKYNAVVTVASHSGKRTLRARGSCGS